MSDEETPVSADVSVKRSASVSSAERTLDGAADHASENVVFLGGLLLDGQIDQIERDSRGGVQYAADALQRALLRGLIQDPGIDLRIVNVPFVGSYPKTYRKIWFPAYSGVLFDRVPFTGMGFFNLGLVRYFARRRAASQGLKSVVPATGQSVIIIYSAHMPFIRAALEYRKAHPGVRVCAIVPDLIEHMGETKFLRRWLILLESRAFRKRLPEMDFFVFLTRHVAEELGVESDRHVVIEGIYDPEPPQPPPTWPDEPGPIFIYTGTLARRYGILDLLEAFARLELPTARLWICGAGDAQDAVEALARRDARVTFHGRVPRAEAMALQARAHVMVNPRRPEGEFTRYSFPSKTMEYLASGRPVIMHWLPGIPDEYRPYLITPETGDDRGLEAAMRRAAALPPEELRRIGAEGRDFVLTRKTPRVQVGKLLAGLFPGWTGDK